MVAPLKKTFTAVLEPDGTALRWVIARVPFDVGKVWPMLVRRRVRGEIGGFAFRTSLFPASGGSGHVLLVNRKMQAEAGVRVGERARITLEPDLEAREAEIPPELARELKGDGKLQRWFGRLSPSTRREIGKWVGEPKSAASRQKRAARLAERLYLAMEGEKEPPPVLRILFQRDPLAHAGWEALTPIQRRNHLLGIFYYETPDGRERRAAKAVEEGLRALHRKAGAGG